MNRLGALLAKARASRRGSTLEILALALVAYVPFLLSSPGDVPADTKQYLFLDPDRLLERAPYMWDPHIGAGTVPHQNIGYLFPMGPFFWVLEHVGVPDWVAQRLWLGTITFAAGLGVRWLFGMLGIRRAGVIAGVAVYILTPYQLSFTARMSILLLPWAGLPWLVGLAMRAVRRGGWRDPVLFALVVFVVAGTNASALMFALIGPGLWIVTEALRDPARRRAAITAVGRIAVPTVGVSLWWAGALRTQSAYGLPVLDLTENLRTVSASSLPSDLLRGLGNWFFYGGDRLGYSLDQTASFADNKLVIAATFIVPLAALTSAAFVRWRYRTYFVVFVVVGTVIGVGAWPFEHPSPFGQIFKALGEGTSLGLAFRNTARIGPVIVLGLAALIAAGVSALAFRVKLERLAAVAVVIAAAVALAPVWGDGFLSSRLKRDGDIPAYWHEAAAALDRAGDATRVLEIPGSNFATYRWGNTVDPVTPGLIDRPWVAREVLPYGSPESVNYLAALDHRLQEGTFEPETLAAYARLMSVGTVVLRSDLEFERFDTPRPRLLWAQLTTPVVDGLGDPRGHGARTRNEASDALPMLDELELRSDADAEDPPPVARFEVDDPVPIVHTAPTRAPVIVAGDAEGIVDAIAAGILDGDELVLELAALDDDDLRDALDAGGTLVLTDSNRRRATSWFALLRDATGATERAGQQGLVDDPLDFRLRVFPGSGDESRTVAEQRGGLVDATGYGEASRYTPEDRPVHAIDGDLTTAWRVAGTRTEEAARLVVRPDRPVTANELTLVQPQTGARDRWLTRVRIDFGDGTSRVVDLGPESRTPEGQLVQFDERTIRRLEIEPLDTNAGAIDDESLLNPVGFAEVRLGDVVVTETVRLPLDLARRVGSDAGDHPVAVVLTRARTEPGDRERQDEELALVRRLVLPDARSFGVSGTARVNPNAPDEIIDAVLGTTAPGATYGSSGHLAGDPEARASRAFDGDPSTAWTSAFGPQEGQSLEIELASPRTVAQLELTVVADARHSVPTRVRIQSEGEERTVPVSRIERGPEGRARTITLELDAPLTDTSFTVVIDAVDPATTTDDRTDAPIALPVSIADLVLDGDMPRPAAPSAVPPTCRSDLLRIDGRPVDVRIAGEAQDARRGLELEACAELPELGAGSHRVSSAPGLDTGIDIDRITLSSDASGDAAMPAAMDIPARQSGARVEITDSGPTSFDLKVRTDGEPFWLVLGQSRSDGWTAKIDDRSLGTPRLVNGYANGWRVEPERAGTVTVALRWTPQRVVWLGIALSALTVIACFVLLLLTRRRVQAAAVDDVPVWAPPWELDGVLPSTRVVLGAAALSAVGAAAVSRWWIGVLVGIGTVVALRINTGRVVFALGSPAALALSKVAGVPELGWLAVALLAADVLCVWLRRRNARV